MQIIPLTPSINVETCFLDHSILGGLKIVVWEGGTYPCKAKASSYLSKISISQKQFAAIGRCNNAINTKMFQLILTRIVDGLSICVIYISSVLRVSIYYNWLSNKWVQYRSKITMLCYVNLIMAITMFTLLFLLRFCI